MGFLSVILEPRQNYKACNFLSQVCQRSKGGFLEADAKSDPVLKAAYPDILYISTAYNENVDYMIDIPAGAMWDTHHYEEPDFFIDGFDFYDR